MNNVTEFRRYSESVNNRLIVVQHYYPEREPNLYQIIDHLTDMDYRVLVWDNNPEHHVVIHSWFRPQVQVVRCPNNPIHGRYLAALIYPEIEYFLFQDDDLLLEKDTIEKLFRAAEFSHINFHGIEGRQFDWSSDKPYTNARSVTYPERADMVLRAYACHRLAMAYGVHRILNEGIIPGRSEALLFTAGYQPNLVPDTSFTNLPENGIGLSHAGQAHWDEIDEFANKYLRQKVTT